MTAFVDTNVLVYAQGPGAKGDTARQMLLEGGIVSVQVLNESANVLRKKFRLDRPVVAEAVADVRALFEPIQPVDIATHDAALALASAHGFNFNDTLIVASALDAGCETLSTEDLQAGRLIDGLVIVNRSRRKHPDYDRFRLTVRYRHSGRCERAAGRLPAIRNELLYRQPDVANDAAQQDRRQVASTMHRHRRRPTVRVAKALVRAALANLLEAERQENGNDLSRLQDGNRRHPGSRVISRYGFGLISRGLETDTGRVGAA